MNNQQIQFGPELILIIIINVILVIIEGIAVWKSAAQHQRNWFIALFICALIPIPLFAILDIIYLFKFSKKQLTFEEIRSWFQRKK